MKLSNSTVRKGLVRAFLLCAVLLFAGGTGATAAGPFLEPDVEVLHTFTGENIGDTFGWVAADLGDLNGDGVKELLIPAILNGENGPAAGKVYIYSGRDQTLLRAHLGNPGETYGYSASNAEDVNADGVSDYIIGGPGGGATNEIGPTGRELSNGICRGAGGG